ncbi:uncharacterized protein LOC108624141 isoform X2 [Ceratina calcarata]|nr:uncharacterized protein LOC108624141 isoform X2 [Ceratina calcarata]XP_017878723.1 uncharacterized protein LOC108624141 isoform X2 [Ceratina calcarata]
MNTCNPRWEQKNFHNFNNSNLRHRDSDIDTDSDTDIHSDTDTDDEYDDEYYDEDYRDIDDTDDASLNHRLNTSCILPSESFKTAQSSPIDKPRKRKKNLNDNSLPVWHKVQNKNQKRSTESFTELLCAIVCIIVVFFFLYIAVYRKNKMDEKVTVDENKLREIYLNQASNKLDKSVDVIRKRFQNQKATIWNDISAGIYDVALFPTRPSIIILFGNETETLNCLAELLAEVSGDILGSNDHLTLMSDDFPNDVGQVIDILKERIVQKKSVVIQDLLSINTEALKAFHNFCDREKPLVGHAVYIITIIVDGYKPSFGELRFVEQQIYKRLKAQIDKDNISPLITRLTDGVVAPILPEPNTKFDNSYCSLAVNKL